MRAVVALFALAFPFLVTAQVVCDSGDALCCFDSADATDDNISQLNELQDILLSTGVSGSIGLLCTPLDSTCTDNQFCCTDNNYGGATALGCSPAPASTRRRRWLSV
ncbi:hypothetical protein M413DRAFT_32515 [Hebeloma cylindrosporum]|uniref:Hydrophobin n=1 Tax=Hebeloma cylindrosporum TaxID=76867 RepID=A0A0C2Y2S1_HEBCY|nr:hypothetical protein M413DRAFT_32515 [Hebeloma cylindrosporum h7]